MAQDQYFRYLALGLESQCLGLGLHAHCFGLDLAVLVLVLILVASLRHNLYIKWFDSPLVSLKKILTDSFTLHSVNFFE
jgi:hypothetical protein